MSYSNGGPVIRRQLTGLHLYQRQRRLAQSRRGQPLNDPDTRRAVSIDFADEDEARLHRESGHYGRTGAGSAQAPVQPSDASLLTSDSRASRTSTAVTVAPQRPFAEIVGEMNHRMRKW